MSSFYGGPTVIEDYVPFDPEFDVDDMLDEEDMDWECLVEPWDE